MVFSFGQQFSHCWKEDYANTPFGVICRQLKLVFLVLFLTTAASSINSFSFFYFLLRFSFNVHRTSAQSSILRLLCWAGRLGTVLRKHICSKRSLLEQKYYWWQQLYAVLLLGFLLLGLISVSGIFFYRITSVIPMPVFIVNTDKYHFWQHTLLYISVQLKII